MSDLDLQETGTPGFDLDPFEVRVLAVLIEKSFVTPDGYPLSVNAIVTGCNQLTGREPVMELSEDTVQRAIDGLLARKLISKRDQAGARVAKYEHLIRLRHSLPPPEQAVLALLMLRGAQTAGEIRGRAERMHRFDDIAAVEAVLEHLAEKYPPMVAPLPRIPGTKETRFVHLMGGDAVLAEAAEFASAAPLATMPLAGGAPRGRTAELEDEVRRLRQEVDWLRGEFEKFRAQFE